MIIVGILLFIYNKLIIAINFMCKIIISDSKLVKTYTIYL